MNINVYHAGEYAYTQLLQSIISEISEEFKGFHSREEAMHYFSKLKNHINDKKYDAMLDPYDTLMRILMGSNDDFNALMAKDTSESDPSKKKFPVILNEDNLEQIQYAMSEFEKAIEKLPTMDDMDLIFLEFLYKKYKNFKSSEDYMRRLVRARLSQISPELLEENASTGVLIMRQFIKKFGCGLIKTESDEEIRIEDRNKGAGRPNANSYYSESIRTLCEEKYKGSFEEMAKNLSQDDYTVLVHKGKAGKCNFAKIADALSAGYFNNQGKMREYVYIFAIAFDMTCSALENFGKKGEDHSEENHDTESTKKWRDINECLFFEFYADNLVNQMSRNEETAIDGYGINWKNFAEIIYLYYLHRMNKGDLSSAEALCSALKLCYRCHTDRSAKTASDLYDDSESDPRGTAYYRENILKTIMELENADDVQKMIVDHFECKLEKRINKKGELETPSRSYTDYSSETRTASAFYEFLMRSCMPYEDKPSDIFYSFWFDFLEEDKNDYVRIHYKDGKLFNGNRSIAVDESFIACINNFTTRYLVGFESSNYNNEIIIHRTDLLSAYAEYYVVQYFESTRNSVLPSFSDFFQTFCSHEVRISEDTFFGINDILIRCGYQEINTKNIFDILITYTAYKKCYMINCMERI